MHTSEMISKHRSTTTSWDLAPSDHLNHLPNELLLLILEKLDFLSLCRVACCNRKLQAACTEDSLWRNEAKALHYTLLNYLQFCHPQQASSIEQRVFLPNTHCRLISKCYRENIDMLLQQTKSYTQVAKIYIAHFLVSRNDISSDYLTKKGDQVLKEQARALANSQTICIYSEHCSHESHWAYLLKAISLLPRRPKLEFLTLPPANHLQLLRKFCKIGGIKPKSLHINTPLTTPSDWDGFLGIIKQCPQLERLHFTDARIDRARVPELVKALSKLQALRSVELPHVDDNYLFFVPLLISLFRLPKIQHVGVQKLSEQQHEVFREALNYTKWSSISISSTYFSDKNTSALSRAVSEYSSLSCFALPKCTFEGEQAGLIYSLKQKKLKWFQLPLNLHDTPSNTPKVTRQARINRALHYFFS